MFFQGCTTLLHCILCLFAFLSEVREESFSEEVPCSVGATLQRRCLVQIKEEEGHFWQVLLLQLRLVSLLNLLQIEDGLPLGIGLV